MSIFSLGARIISRISPLLLVAGGVALVWALLPDRRCRFRPAAVKVTKGVLIAKDEVKNAAARMSAKASDLVEEARQSRTDCCSGAAVTESLKDSAKAKGRRMAVATTAKVLTMKEKARAEFNSIVAEAKENRAVRSAESNGEDRVPGL